MHDISAIVLFCEDIREEKSGMYSLIGILGDNVLVPNFPSAMPKLGIYVRISIPLPNDADSCSISLILSDGEETPLNVIEKSMVENTITDATSAGNEVAGIYSHMIASPFPILKEGRIIVQLEAGGNKRYLGSLNFVKALETA